ncbi:hypothetical protein [Paraclostridium bifermentans]|uniref:hypothetical protein n=1 Tax=Paraclostridium bifermentans TaxID=1490 RepID=UPI00374F0131
MCNNFKLRSTFKSNLRNIVTSRESYGYIIHNKTDELRLGDLIHSNYEHMRKSYFYMTDELERTILNRLTCTVESIKYNYRKWNINNIALKLRKCRNWEEVCNATLEHLKENGLPIITDSYNMIDYFLTESAIITYLCYQGIYLVNDDIYKSLNTPRAHSRIKFDYINDGLPLLSKPITTKKGLVRKVLNTCEYYYKAIGTIPMEYKLTDEYISVYYGLLEKELRKSKYKTNYKYYTDKYIHMTENLTLDCLKHGIFTEENYGYISALHDSLLQELSSCNSICKVIDVANEYRKRYLVYYEELYNVYLGRINLFDKVLPNRCNIKALVERHSGNRETLRVVNHLSTLRQIVLTTLCLELKTIIDKLIKELQCILLKHTSKLKSKRFNTYVCNFCKELKSYEHRLKLNRKIKLNDNLYFKSCTGKTILISTLVNV